MKSSTGRRPPLLAITAGDPCGIGPEVILNTLTVAALRHPTVVIGDLDVFVRTAHRLKRRLPNWTVIPRRAGLDARSGRLTFLDLRHRGRFTPGRSSAGAGAASLDYIEEAVRLWRRGLIQGLVTAPVTKWAVARVQPRFVGQTEYLARAMGCRGVVMMFVSQRLRVALLTRHLPLRRVSSAITPRLLRSTIRLTHEALATTFGIPRPRLAICGMNPHAGEAGRCGQEERRVMIPVLRALRREGIVCDGPFAADGFFAERARYDAVVCSYHDQGLIPFKMAARDAGCQISLGLPIVRTSPDHGSALDIAGKGIADPGSMRYALQLAARLMSR